MSATSDTSPTSQSNKAEGKLKILAGSVLILAFPFVPGVGVPLLNIGVMVGIYFMVCIGLSLIFGIGGQLSLAQAAFYGLGAYTSALLSVRLAIPVLLSFVIATVVSGVLAWLLARPLLRLRTVYLAMATLSFGDILIILVREQKDLTGGSTGIIDLPVPTIFSFEFGNAFRYYFLVWVLALIAVWISYNLVKSRIGLGLRALADSEVGAASSGVDVAVFKVWMFTIGGAFAGLAGALYAHYISFINPDMFNSNFSIMMIMILAIGGKSSFSGAFIGAVLATLLPFFLAGYGVYSPLIFSVLFLGVVMSFPDGLAGLLRRLSSSVAGKGG